MFYTVEVYPRWDYDIHVWSGRVYLTEEIKTTKGNKKELIIKMRVLEEKRR